MSKLAVSLLLSLLARAATPSGGQDVCMDASLDRIEEEFAVLDVAEYPSINVPVAMAVGIPEGAPVQVCAYTKGAELTFYLTRDWAREQYNRDVLKKHKTQ